MLIFILLTAALADLSRWRPPSHHPSNNTWGRYILTGKDLYNVTAAANRVSDPHGARTIAFGLGYTAADILAQKQAANSRFIQQFGIDVMGTGVYNATTDVYAIPGVGQSVTYANGDNYLYRVVYDSANDRVHKRRNHIIYHWGMLFQFSGPGVFPGGKMEGKPYAKWEIMGATIQESLDLSMRHHWANPRRCDWKCRDISDNGSERLAQAVSNSDIQPNGVALVNNYEMAEMINRRTGHKGHLTGHVTNRYLDDGVTTLQRTRGVLTYGIMSIDPPPSAL